MVIRTDLVFSHRVDADVVYPKKPGVSIIPASDYEEDITGYADATVHINAYPLVGYSELRVGPYRYTITGNDRLEFGPVIDQFLAENGLKRTGIKLKGSVLYIDIERL